MSPTTYRTLRAMQAGIDSVPEASLADVLYALGVELAILVEVIRENGVDADVIAATINAATAEGADMYRENASKTAEPDPNAN